MAQIPLSIPDWGDLPAIPRRRRLRRRRVQARSSADLSSPRPPAPPRRPAHTPGTLVLTIGGWLSSAAAGIKPPALGEAQPAPSAPAPRPTACSQTAQPWWRRSVPPWPSTPGRAARRLPIRMAPRTCPGGGSTSHCGPPTSPRLPEQGVTWRQMRPLTPSASNTSATPPHGARERCAYGGPSRCLHQGLTRPSYCPPWCRCPPAPRGFMPVNGFGAADCLGDQLDRGIFIMCLSLSELTG